MRLMARRAKLFDQGEWSDFQVFGTGAILFYIRPGNNGAKYRFYDASYNLITDLQPGDSPIYYKVLGEDKKTFDKYFVLSAYYISGLAWTYYNSGSAVTEVTGANKTAVGTGRWNTNRMLGKSAYVSNDDTMWYSLNKNFISASGSAHCGCSDWYIPSSGELEILMAATKRDGSYIVTSRTHDDVHSSTESTYYYCTNWLKSDSTMGNVHKGQYDDAYVIRSF